MNNIYLYQDVAHVLILGVRTCG